MSAIEPVSEHNGGMTLTIPSSAEPGPALGPDRGPLLTTLPIADITVDPDVQQRVHHTDPDLIADYAEAVRAGVNFPPVIVFDDGEHIWLADGFHRIEAAQAAGQTAILADVRRGSRRDALLAYRGRPPGSAGVAVDV